MKTEIEKKDVLKITSEIKRTILMLSVHPHNEIGSEFFDRINGLSEALEILKNSNNH